MLNHEMKQDQGQCLALNATQLGEQTGCTDHFFLFSVPLKLAKLHSCNMAVEKKKKAECHKQHASKSKLLMELRDYSFV